MIDGKGWRSGATIERRNMPQWFLRITDYCEELLEGLDDLDWPEQVKVMQRNWIGRSEGYEIDFEIPHLDTAISVYTTRTDTLFGATYLALAPEHPIVQEIASLDNNVQQFLEDTKSQAVSEEALEKMEKKGVPLGFNAINPINGEEIPVWTANFVLMTYGTGSIMSVPAHDQRDHDFAKKYDLHIQPVIRSNDKDSNHDFNKEAYIEEGILFNSGNYDGVSSAQAKDQIGELLTDKNAAKKVINYRLRDWLISRQRYWGAPIPVLTNEQGDLVSESDENLPVSLPEEVEFDGVHSPLKTMSDFYEVNDRDIPLVRETDTFDTFMESSWYYARFCSSDSDKAMLDDRAKYWLPVDLYIGGIEHAILHLLYARFYHKLLRDEGLVEGNEPFKRLLTQGMVLNDGAKMSKSLGNTVDPEEMIQNYGADTVRLFMMFTSPPEQSLEWSDTAINGSYRFLKKLWKLIKTHQDSIKDISGISSNEKFNGNQNKLRRKTHQTISKVTDDIGRRYTFNTAIAAVMELVNEVSAFNVDDELDRQVIKEAIESILLLLSPIVPHICHQLWLDINHDQPIIDARWPKYDSRLLKSETSLIVVQVNGKLRSKLEVDASISEDELKSMALSDEKVVRFIDGNEIKKIIVIPEKLVNIVV